jgi:hypothetical protein
MPVRHRGQGDPADDPAAVPGHQPVAGLAGSRQREIPAGPERSWVLVSTTCRPGRTTLEAGEELRSTGRRPLR